MFYCCKCGYKINDEDCFCSHCGYSIKERKEMDKLNLKTNTSIANSDLIKAVSDKIKTVKLNKLSSVAFMKSNKSKQFISLFLLIFQLLIIGPIAEDYSPKVVNDFRDLITLSMFFLITVLALDYFKLLKGTLFKIMNIAGAIISVLPCLVFYESIRRVSGFFEIIDMYHQSYFLAFSGIIIPIVTTILLMISYISANKHNTYKNSTC